MGEIAEMIIDGLLCQECGGLIDEEEPGYPRICDYCTEENKKEKRLICRQAKSVSNKNNIK